MLLTKTPSKGSRILVGETAEREKELKVANDNKKTVSSRPSLSFTYKRKAIGTAIQNLCMQSQMEPQPGEGSWTHNPTPANVGCWERKREFCRRVWPLVSQLHRCGKVQYLSSTNWSFIVF